MFPAEAAFTLLRLLAEEGRVVLENRTERQAPYIKEDEEDSYQVMVEGVEVARSETLKDALLLLAIAVYVFNQKLSSKCPIRSFMWFMSEKIMGLPRETNASANAVANMIKVMAMGVSRASLSAADRPDSAAR